jgi:hypothetical protein
MRSATRVLLALLLIAVHLQATCAFLSLDSAILGGGASIMAYGAGLLLLGPAAPIGAAVAFVGTTYKIEQWKADSFTLTLHRRKESVKLENLQWHDCSKPPTFSAYTHCSYSKYGKCYDRFAMHGHHNGCNGCGARALVTQRLVEPENLENPAVEHLCKSIETGELFKPSFDTTQPNFVNCTQLPHYAMCKQCGPGTDTAAYGWTVTAMGVPLTCRAQNGVETMTFVKEF